MKIKIDASYRAVLKPRTIERLEHWEVQERRQFLFRSFAWHPIAVVETKEEAQEYINRMERASVLYPQEEFLAPESP